MGGLDNMPSDMNTEAVELIDRLRRSHGGLSQVTLYLCTDGSNACAFGTFENNVGLGESSTSLLEAVKNAYADWRYRNLTLTPHGRHTVLCCIEGAIEKTGRGSRVFGTDGFFDMVNGPDAYVLLSHSQSLALLEGHPRVVRLNGGLHWMLLPEGITRYKAETCGPQVTSR